MKRVLVLVEGQTEEGFVKQILQPSLWDRNISIEPKIVVTKRAKHGAHFKGGILNYRQVATDLHLLLRDSNAVKITTFMDYYGLPEDFPGMSDRPLGNARKRVEHVESVWKQNITDTRFHPYLMLHEFEALMFVSPDELAKGLHQPHLTSALHAEKASFANPEEINDSPETAPSKRILKILSGYQKSVHGPMIAGRIGLKLLRKDCPKFNDWMSLLENM